MPVKTITSPKPVRPRRDDAYQEVLKRILTSEIVPGARIVESRLAEELGVSRTPLREALLQLEQEGYVIAEPNRGYSAAELSAREIRETYPILGSLEALALQATGYAVADHLAVLNEINEKFVSHASHPELAIQYDIQFHQQLLAACPNGKLVGYITELRRCVERYERKFLRGELVVRDSAKQHQQILAAIEQGELSEAATRLQANWVSGIDWMVTALGEC